MMYAQPKSVYATQEKNLQNNLFMVESAWCVYVARFFSRSTLPSHFVDLFISRQYFFNVFFFCLAR